MYDISPDGADSSIKVDLSRRVIKLSGNSTLGDQSVILNPGAGGSRASIVVFSGDRFSDLFSRHYCEISRDIT